MDYAVGVRVQQREATRGLILGAAVDALIASGYSAISTMAVQRAAGVSRGALLHYFPTRAQLVQGLVAHLVESNEAAVREISASLPAELDAVSRAVRALFEALSRPAFEAELELWAAARTDPELRAALRVAERAAGRDLRRVVDEVFGPQLVAQPCYPLIAELTVMLIRGLAVSSALRAGNRAARDLVEQWADLVRDIFGHPSAPSNSPAIDHRSVL